MLLFHEAKRRPGVLLGIAAAVVALHFVDVCWLVLPTRFEPRASHIPWDEVGLALLATAGIGGVSVATFVAFLGGRGRDSSPDRAFTPNTHPATGG